MNESANAKAQQVSRHGVAWFTLTVFALAVGFLILIFAQKGQSTDPHGWAVLAFLVDLAFVGTTVLSVGYAVTGRPFGILISSWNDYSLSRLQMVLWTVVVLAALLVSVEINLLEYFGKPNQNQTALGIDIPPDLLAAMGIAAFSTAAAPSILALKAGQKPDADQSAVARERLADLTGGDPQNVTNVGKAVGRANGEDAHWLDILTGDEVANAGLVDLSKVQNLLITLLLIGGYVGMMIQFLATTGKWIDGLPGLSDQFIGLMAISHGGYLVYKAAPKASQTVTKDQNPAAAAAPPGVAGPVPTPAPVPPPLPPRPPTP